MHKICPFYINKKFKKKWINMKYTQMCRLHIPNSRSVLIPC